MLRSSGSFVAAVLLHRNVPAFASGNLCACSSAFVVFPTSPPKSKSYSKSASAPIQRSSQRQLYNSPPALPRSVPTANYCKPPTPKPPTTTSQTSEPLAGSAGMSTSAPAHHHRRKQQLNPSANPSYGWHESRRSRRSPGRKSESQTPPPLTLRSKSPSPVSPCM